MNFYAPTLHGVVLNFFPRGACHCREGALRIRLSACRSRRYDVYEGGASFADALRTEVDFFHATSRPQPKSCPERPPDEFRRAVWALMCEWQLSFGPNKRFRHCSRSSDRRNRRDPDHQAHSLHAPGRPQARGLVNPLHRWRPRHRARDRNCAPDRDPVQQNRIAV